jgi:hypothetical protein
VEVGAVDVLLSQLLDLFTLAEERELASTKNGQPGFEVCYVSCVARIVLLSSNRINHRQLA